MKHIATIKGKPIIDIYESFNGSYWYVVEKAFKQDSVIDGTVYKDDQILFGYVRLAHCPEFAEFGYFSEAELRQLRGRVWKVHRCDWAVCPDVELEEARDRTPAGPDGGDGTNVPPVPCGPSRTTRT